MPAAYDIYSDQLRELRRGQALYYPEPSPEDGPVQIGDVGYTKQGAFCRLFNVSKPANDLAQILGVPEGFEPLYMGRIRTFDAALEPGPLHSKTIFRVNADIGSPGYGIAIYILNQNSPTNPGLFCLRRLPFAFHVHRRVGRSSCWKPR